jgi:hypothetical protein
MKTKSALVTVAVVGMLAMSIQPASAHARAKLDLNDSPSPLDIRGAAFGHTSARVMTIMGTYGRWRASVLSKRDTAVYFTYDTVGGPKFDYFVWVHYRSGRLVAKLRKVVTGGSVYLQKVPVKKDGKFVSVNFRSRLIRASGYLRWKVFTSFASSNFCKNTCWDSAPNRGMVPHDL